MFSSWIKKCEKKESFIKKMLKQCHVTAILNKNGVICIFQLLPTTSWLAILNICSLYENLAVWNECDHRCALMWQFLCGRWMQNSLVPNRQQAFTWTNDVLVYCCMYASPGLRVLKYHAWRLPGPRFNTKMSPYQYRKSHCGDKTVGRKIVLSPQWYCLYW